MNDDTIQNTMGCNYVAVLSSQLYSVNDAHDINELEFMTKQMTCFMTAIGDRGDKCIDVAFREVCNCIDCVVAVVPVAYQHSVLVIYSIG